MAAKKKIKKRPPSMKGVSRIDQEEKNNHGWFVRLMRDGERYSAFFADKKNGGKGKALALAKKAYAAMVRDHAKKVAKKKR
jgi:hypothetical protein